MVSPAVRKQQIKIKMIQINSGHFTGCGSKNGKKSKFKKMCLKFTKKIFEKSVN